MTSTYMLIVLLNILLQSIIYNSKPRHVYISKPITWSPYLENILHISMSLHAMAEERQRLNILMYSFLVDLSWENAKKSQVDAKTRDKECFHGLWKLKKESMRMTRTEVIHEKISLNHMKIHKKLWTRFGDLWKSL